MSKKKNLIEALYGSFMFLDNLPDLIDRENIYEILDALSFPSSQDKARNIMQMRKRPQW